MTARDDIFWDDPESGVVKTYADLIHDLNVASTVAAGAGPPLHRSSEAGTAPYRLFRDVLHALAHGYRIGVRQDEADDAYAVDPGDVDPAVFPEIVDWSELIRRIESHRSSPVIGLFTSGTTGAPRPALHSLATLARGVKTGGRHRDATWGLAYNPSHIAAMHVFLQAFLNRNPIVYVFRLSGSRLFECLRNRGITHISATPTFYRRLLFSEGPPLPDVRVASCGGEPLAPELVDDLQVLFPSARILNIYALTEAGSLFASEGETFVIPLSMRGKVHISENKELLLHRSLLAEFDEDPSQEWYHTGDVVERVDSDRFRIVHRETEMINVGGYSVDPHEVERTILLLDDVVDVAVRGRSNRITGNVLEAVVVKHGDRSADELEDAIVRHVSARLPSFKVPRLVRFVTELDLTRTGKKERT